MLAALSVILKGCTRQKLSGDESFAYSYVDKFFGFRGENKIFDTKYLLNRAWDLSIWYLLPMLIDKGYPLKGKPVIVTGDRVLHRLIFRCLPPVNCEKGVVFGVAQGEIGADFSQKICEILENLKPRKNSTLEENNARLEFLFKWATDQLFELKEKQVLTDAWENYCKPGIGIEFKF